MGVVMGEPDCTRCACCGSCVGDAGEVMNGEALCSFCVAECLDECGADQLADADAEAAS